MVGLINDPQFIENEEIPLNSAELVRCINPPIQNNTLKRLYKALTDKHCNVEHSLGVTAGSEKKFIDLIPLESESHVWSRVFTSFPAGQHSFLIRAGIECLPTIVTLSRWRYRCDSSCKLCHFSPCTVHHILNCCPVGLNQGRYTQRHDSVLQCLFHILKSTDTEIYADLPGLRASDSPPATVPLHVLVTSARPDIVIIEDATITLLELTIPVKVVGTLLPTQLLVMTSWSGNTYVR